jgi:O-antigen/teichoic acid export membrane protein
LITVEKRLFKNYSIYTFGRILGVLSSLVLLPLFTKKIPQEEFGIVGLLWLVQPILIRLINLGVDVSVSLKFFKLKHDELSNYLFNALFVIFSLTMGIWLLFHFNIHWVQWVLDKSMTSLLFNLLYLSIVSSMLRTMMLSFMQLSGKAWQNVLFTVFPPIIVTAITYYLIIFVEPSYTSYITGLSIGNGIFGIVAIFYFFRKYSIRYFKFSKNIIKKLLKVGIPVLPGTLAGLILAAGDRYIIKHFLGLEAVAIYVYGYRFSEYMLISIFQPFQKTIAPILMEKAAKNFNDAFYYSKKLADNVVIFISIIVAIAIIPFKDVMLFLSKDAYTLSFTIFLISLVGILLNNISNIYNILFNHLERTDLNMAMGVSCAILNVCLNIWLIPKYGIIAAAFTTVISFFFVFILSILLLNRFVENRLNILKILKGLIPIISYIVIIYFIENGFLVNESQTFSLYGYKITAFILFILGSFYTSDEFKNSISKGLGYVRVYISGIN